MLRKYTLMYHLVPIEMIGLLLGVHVYQLDLTGLMRHDLDSTQPHCQLQGHTWLPLAFCPYRVQGQLAMGKCDLSYQL